VRLRTRALGALSALAVAGSLISVTAVAAHADEVANCSGATLIAATPSTGPALTDTVGPVTMGVHAAKTVADGSVPKGTVLGGTCPTSIPPSGTSSPLHPKAIAAKWTGAISCQELDYNASDGTYPLNGNLTITMTETIPATSPPKSYQIASYVKIGSGDNLDTLSVSGIVTKGVAVGSLVGGSLWYDPVFKLMSPGKTRTVTDGHTTNGSADVVSVKANFTSVDINASVTGAGIPANTVITAVNPSTHTATLSHNATADGTNVSLTIVDDPGYLNTGYRLGTLADVLPCLDGVDGNFSTSSIMLGDGNSPITNTATTGLQYLL